jgi:inositol transport system permease protein
VSIYGIIAVGMTYVILIGGIDVAVGSLLASRLARAAYVVTRRRRLLPGELADRLPFPAWSALAGGYVHGKAVTWLNVPAFIVTLGGMTVWRGATLILNDGGPISGFDAAYRWWGTGDILFVPVPIAVFALVAALGHVVLRYTRYGRQVYAVGGNAEAARLSGVNVDFIVTSVYAVIGALAGLSGFLLSARLGSAEAVAGTGYELRVIASVVIGGASLTGGLGRRGRHHPGRPADRRAVERPGDHARQLVLPAGGDRPDHRRRGGLRSLRQVPPQRQALNGHRQTSQTDSQTTTEKTACKH